MLNLIKNLPNHLKVTISAWIARGIVAITNLIAIKILLPYLGTDSYAIYIILISFASWCALTDFGIGFSLQNYISEFKVKKQNYQPYINSAFQIIIVFTIVAIILSLLLYSPIQNFILKKYLSILDVQSVNIVLISLILLIMIGVINISSKVYYALQKGTIPNILTSIAYIISLCAMIVVVNTQGENNRILKVILCYTLPQIILLGYLFIKIFNKSLLNILNINKNILNDLFNRSMKFGGIAMMELAVCEVDYFIMAKTVSPEDIAVYSIFTKIFLLAFTIYSCLLHAFWPKSSELFFTKNFKELIEDIKKYIFYGSILLMFTIIITFILKAKVFKVFLPMISYNLPISFFILFIGYGLLRVISTTFEIVLQSFNCLNIFYICIPIQIVINVCTQFYFSIKYGIKGIVFGLLISFLLTSAWILPYKFYKIIKKIYKQV